MDKAEAIKIARKYVNAVRLNHTHSLNQILSFLIQLWQKY